MKNLVFGGFDEIQKYQPYFLSAGVLSEIFSGELKESEQFSGTGHWLFC